jgi:hypothetical protein
MSRQVFVAGDLHAITPEGVATGWCWSPQEPATRRAIALIAADQRLATAVCDEPSEALLGIGVGDGAHGFTVQLARELLPAAAGVVEVQIQDLKTGCYVGKRLSYGSARAAAPPPPMRVSLDRAGEDGLITGWCWNPAAPDQRIRLLVLVDGEPVGSTRADMFRGDLVAAGIGDGAHGFNYLLPWPAIAAKSVSHVALQDADTGQLLPAATVFRRPSVRPIEDRLRSVERQLKLLAGRLEDTQRRARHDAAVANGVFATIGAFFTRLAETPPEAAPRALVPSLAVLLDTMAASRPPLTLAGCANPLLTLCIDADGTAQEIYDCLRALHAAKVDQQAEIVLIDGGGSDAAALLTASVQNLRHWRVQPGQSVPEARNTAVLPAGRAFAGFLSSRAQVSADWLPTALATFQRLPDCAVLGAKLVRPEGTIEASGLLPDGADQLADFARGEHEWTPSCDMRRPVAAVADLAMLVRGDAFARQLGFDTALVDPAAAAIELCLRLWGAGAQVCYQPVGEVRWLGAGLTGARTDADPEQMPWLAHRWFSAVPDAWPREPDRLLLLDEADGESGDRHPDAIDMPTLAAALIGLGLQVDFAVPDRLDRPEERAKVLRSLGVRVFRAPFQPSVAAAIGRESQPYAAIMLTSGATSALSLDLVRTLSPASRIVLLMQPDAAAALAGSVDAPGRESLVAAINTCDLVLTAQTDSYTAIGVVSPAANCALLDPDRPHRVRRSGLLILAGPSARGALGDRRILAAIAKALPGVPIYRQDRSGAAPLPGVTDSDGEPGVLFARLRLALALFPRLGDAPAVTDCLAAGLPVVAIDAATGSAPVPAGVAIAPAEARGFAQVVAALYRDEGAWTALANATRRTASKAGRFAPRELATALRPGFETLGVALTLPPVQP